MRRPAAIITGLGRWFTSLLARNGENVVTAFVQIWAHKGRAILTTLGIIIAVTSIISVVAFVEGFGNHVANMLRGYGTQFMVVYPFVPPELRRRGMGRVRLDMDDVEAIRTECSSLRRVSPGIGEQVEVTYGGEVAKEVVLRGVSEQYQTIRNFHVDKGRFFGPIDVEQSPYVCVLGRSLLELLSCDESIIGDYVQVGEKRFRVIGLLESKGSFMGDDQDQTVIVPYTAALQMFPERKERVVFLAEATSEEALNRAEAQIRRLLRLRHGLSGRQPDDFQIARQDQAVNEFTQIQIAVTSILAGIVSISLLVGGIGIMNVMLVSVTERTREIGLRKSVGGRRRDILLQFLTEAVALTTVGGAIGIGLGYPSSCIGIGPYPVVLLEILND